jgi:AraC-like DNA-binding protein
MRCLGVQDGSFRVQSINHWLTNSFPGHRQRPSLSLAIIHAGVQALASRGVDLEQLQVQWGVRLNYLRQPNLRLPAFLARRFWEVARELSGDPAIGLAAARQADPSLMLGLAYLMELMPSRLAALEVLVRYWPLVAGHMHHEWEERAGRLHLSLAPSQALLAADEEVDYWCARQIQHLQGRLGAPQAVLEWHLQRAEPADPVPWLAYPGVTVHFGARRNGLVLDLQALGVARPAGSPAVCSALETELEDYARRSSHEFTLETVANAVLAGMHENLSLEALAQRLHTTERTLQRNLLREGWVFSDIVELQRRYLAADLLHGDELSISSEADRLGYGETSNFLRAFRRWYGVTPGTFRSNQGARL